MMTESIELSAPNGSAIVGAQTTTGSIAKFTYHYDKTTMTRVYILEVPHDPLLDPTILVDSQGSQWKAEDVECYSLFQRRI
jgi:hypothetical protein